jgi:LmbE family N-acetylglucosaminyl deacetylase
MGVAGLALLGGLRYGLPRAPEQAAANLRALTQRVPAMPAPARRERILVLAPHCDDETLACGGLIAEAVKARAEVRVALATNGDGFHRAAERFLGEIEVPHKDYLTLAAERQAETLAALSTLGLPGRQVTFLGYPDGGTAHMWLDHWAPDHPYTSHFTGDSRNPYPNALHPGAPYAARSMIDDLKTLIGGFKPTVIYCPHPNDDHPDHWALYCYTLAALHESGMLDQVKLRLYLVHRGRRGEWPVPQGLHPSEPMVPPADLANLGTRWQSLPLTSAIVKRKQRALGQYRSQMLVMRGFMLSFARSTEMFGALSVGRLRKVAPGTIRVDGDASDWRGIPVAIRDPVQDLAKVDTTPAADLVAVYAAQDGRRLFLRLEVCRPVSADLAYAFHINLLTPGTVEPAATYVLRPGRETAGVEFRAAGRCVEMSVPLPASPPIIGIMLGADSRLEYHLLDKTAWAMLRGVNR